MNPQVPKNLLFTRYHERRGYGVVRKHKMHGEMRNLCTIFVGKLKEGENLGHLGADGMFHWTEFLSIEFSIDLLYRRCCRFAFS
jgi:hypothetical protein